jgi:hypothetical protein
MKFNLQLGLPEMTEIEELPLGEWRGPAKAVSKGGLTDGLLRNFYRRWRDGRSNRDGPICSRRC